MYLSKGELIRKYPQLEKFKDQKWLSEAVLKADCNYKEIPFFASLILIDEIIDFIERTKFSNRWEEGFSIKLRLQQIRSLLNHFCEDTDQERALKGTDVNPQLPMKKKPRQRKAKLEINQVHLK